MGSLEQAVRRSLTAAALEGPAHPPDPAGTAIRRGRRAHRWYGGGLTLAVAIATVLAAGGLVALHERAGRTVGVGLNGPTRGLAEPTPPAGVLVDVVADSVLVAASGLRIALGRAGTPAAVYESPGGWLVTGAPAEGRTGVGIWFASAATGELTPVLAEPLDAVTVEPGGRRIAWRTGTQLSTADVVDGRAGTPVRTAVPEAAEPVGYAGGSIRLTGVGTGQSLWSGIGAYTPAKIPVEVVGVYGELPDGELVAQVQPDPRTPEKCLALVRPADLSVVRTACGLVLSAGAHGWVSPDGRWLVAEAPASDGTQGVLVDLAAVFDGGTRTVGVGSAPAGSAAWEDPGTVVRVASGQLERLRLDRLWTGTAGGAERVDLAAGRLLVVVQTPG